MSSMKCDNRGFTLVEVVIAIFLTVVALLGILALISPGWKTAAKSDYLGRASGILYEQLMTQEAWILNPCNAVTTGAPVQTVVFASGQPTAQPGDVQFNVTTTITRIQTNPCAWLVTVQVSWPPLNATGITESLIVTGQQGFLFPATCVVRTCP
jgi:Tfp pilus assembly protein PilE